MPQGHEKYFGPTEIQKIADRRLMTEVDHLLAARRSEGSFDPEILIAVKENLRTKVQEDAMSGAVTNTFQPAAEIEAENGERRRTFIQRGLGKTAIEIPESGYAFHFSEPAFARVGVEVREGRRSSELTPGITQSFISPKMSLRDAPKQLAEAEHLANEDAIRTSRTVVNENGDIVGRQMQALLVRDVPLSAWVSMFKDPDNIFGKTLEIHDEESALGIMELFNQLDMPDELLPEGPVTIVAEVAKHVEDPVARASVDRQLEKFRGDQANLNTVAETTADKWLEFEKEMAESLHQGKMQRGIRRFVIQMQDIWPKDVKTLLKSHELGADYAMSKKLAAKLEKAWQKVHVGEAAIIVSDERALKNMKVEDVKRIQDSIEYANVLRASGVPEQEIARINTQNYREIAVSQVAPGGGCSKVNDFEFDASDPNGQIPGGIPREQKGEENTSTDRIGKRKMGVCRIPKCPTKSRSGKTEVGGCDVCLEFCQKIFDAGDDPEDVYGRSDSPDDKDHEPEVKSMLGFIDDKPEIQTKKDDKSNSLVAEIESYLGAISSHAALATVE